MSVLTTKILRAEEGMEELLICFFKFMIHDKIFLEGWFRETLKIPRKCAVKFYWEKMAGSNSIL